MLKYYLRRTSTCVSHHVPQFPQLVTSEPNTFFCHLGRKLFRRVQDLLEPTRGRNAWKKAYNRLIFDDADMVLSVNS
jgi:hypothetical protein